MERRSNGENLKILDGVIIINKSAFVRDLLESTINPKQEPVKKSYIEEEMLKNYNSISGFEDGLEILLKNNLIKLAGCWDKEVYYMITKIGAAAVEYNKIITEKNQTPLLQGYKELDPEGFRMKYVALLENLRLEIAGVV